MLISVVTHWSPNLKKPTAMTEAERNELNSYVRHYAADMQTQHGDAVMAGVTAAASTRKSWKKSALINMGGAALGSAAKGEDSTNSMVGAGIGALLCGKIGKVSSEVMPPLVMESTFKVSGSVVGSIVSEVIGDKVKGQLDNAGKNQ
jgi:hypothetical protein